MKVIYEEFDSHVIIKDLMSGGFTENQSEKLVYAMRATRKIDLSHLATKFDLNKLEIKILKWTIAQSGLLLAAIVASKFF